MPPFPKTTCSFLFFHPGYFQTYFSIQLFLKKKKKKKKKSKKSIVNNNSNNILYSSQREAKAVVRSHNYLSTHLLVYVPTDVPENKSTRISNHKDLPGRIKYFLLQDCTGRALAGGRPLCEQFLRLILFDVQGCSRRGVLI